MREILLQRGFKQVGSCNCHGGTTYWFEHVNHPDWRMEVGTASYWVKQRHRPNPNFNTVDFGNQSTFNEKLNKYFNKN